jgi:hypothetical protein
MFGCVYVCVCVSVCVHVCACVYRCACPLFCSAHKLVSSYRAPRPFRRLTRTRTQADGLLTASWSGFQDPESGVLFYEYFMGRSCITAAQYCGATCAPLDGLGMCRKGCTSSLNASLVGQFRATRGQLAAWCACMVAWLHGWVHVCVGASVCMSFDATGLACLCSFSKIAHACSWPQCMVDSMRVVDVTSRSMLLRPVSVSIPRSPCHPFPAAQPHTLTAATGTATSATFAGPLSAGMYFTTVRCGFAGDSELERKWGGVRCAPSWSSCPCDVLAALASQTAQQARTHTRTQVIAYNYALGRSRFVCSDGVLVDVTPPLLADVRVQGVTIVPGLIRGGSGANTTVWLLTADGVRHRVVGANATCAARSLAVPSLEAFPDEGYRPLFSEVVPIVAPNQATHAFDITDGYAALRGNISVPVDTRDACARWVCQGGGPMWALSVESGLVIADVPSLLCSARDAVGLGCAGGGGALLREYCRCPLL